MEVEAGLLGVGAVEEEEEGKPKGSWLERRRWTERARRRESWVGAGLGMLGSGEMVEDEAEEEEEEGS